MAKQDELDELEKKIERAAAEGRIAEEAAYLKAAVLLAEELYGEGSNRHIELMSEYGGLLKYIGKPFEAVEQLLAVKEYLKDSEDRNNYIVSLQNLAGAYRFCKDFEKSESLYLEAKSLLQERGYVYASICNNLGILFQDEKRFAEAEQMHLESKDILKNHAEYTEEFITTLGNLASVYLAEKRWKEAEEQIEEAEKMIKAAEAEGQPIQAAVMNQKGILLYYMGEYDKAIEVLEKAYDICREKMTEESDACMRLYHTMQVIKKKMAEGVSE